MQRINTPRWMNDNTRSILSRSSRKDGQGSKDNGEGCRLTVPIIPTMGCGKNPGRRNETATADGCPASCELGYDSRLDNGN